MEISIHAPRTGSDERDTLKQQLADAFQSTLPARGATWLRNPTKQERTISIHAPRTGSDTRGLLPIIFEGISIHAPRTGSD